MTFTYEATLPDVAEPSVRLFMRGQTYATNRWRGTLVCAAMFAVFAFLGFNAKQSVNLPLVCFAAAAWGAGLFLLAYKSSVRRRIVGYIGTELNGAWPRTTRIEIREGKLIGTSAGASTTYPAGDLIAISEDAKCLELSFGDGRLFVVPLRAFDSTEEKNAFLAAFPRP
jgi:hypothetical protein